jgi:hypothetical protein
MSDEVTPNDLTTLMSLDPLDLTKQDLDRIIAYQRKQRQMREGGARVKKESGAPAVDIKALLGKKIEPKATPAPKPSNGGFIRRF